MMVIMTVISDTLSPTHTDNLMMMVVMLITGI